jgi:hypothetical protein
VKVGKASETIFGKAAVCAALLTLGTALPSAADCTEDLPWLAKRARVLSPADTLPQWGYGYAKLREDLDQWARNPLVRIDSIGATVQGRAIWSVNITEGADSVGRPGDASWRKRRVFVHARTHPAEVQAHHVAVEMIKFLLDSSDLARDIRREYIFNIVPMYNPDGVEMMHPRENANKIDIESNWNKPTLEIEVRSLKKHFEFLQSGPVPVEVALNLHSDQYLCFFFFHQPGGTSPAFADMEKDFIGKVQGHFPGGIKDWSFMTSWPNATGTQYPEGFWWTTQRERVMALTYEDTNCPGAGGYDSTGRALVRGAVDYLRPRIAGLLRFAREETRLLRVGGGWRLSGADREGFSAWSLRGADGRLLAGGRIGSDGAFIPAAAAASRPAILVLSGPANSKPKSVLLPAAAAP